MKRKRQWLVYMLILFSGLYGTGCGREMVSFETENITLTENATAFTETDQNSEDVEGYSSEIQGSSEKAVVYVFVCGAVASEGVYELLAESRIQDALLAAGGFLSEADTDAVNLADIVYDGQRIYFPFEGEPVEYLENTDKVEYTDGRVNINTATKAQLMELPGIGEVKADNIIRYREQNGDFQDIQDIKNVNGIGDSIFLQIEESIIVQ